MDSSSLSSSFFLKASLDGNVYKVLKIFSEINIKIFAECYKLFNTPDSNNYLITFSGFSSFFLALIEEFNALLQLIIPLKHIRVEE